MSTSIGTAASTRTGWFHGDPLAVTAGNFISSSAAGANAPQDSFMVYVGAPVNDAACVNSDGVTRTVYDKQRRWFSEVLKIFGPGANYYEIFARAGDNPADTLAATPSSGPIVIPAATISNVLGGVAGPVRLVFRCKTNRGFSDGDNRNSGYTSFGRGAVQVDNVSIDKGAGPVMIGDFETPQQGGVNAIDNRFPLPPGLLATDVWRTTAKAPPARMHLEPISNLTYNDLCGNVNSPNRLCNISGLVATPGNHDDGENIGDSRFTAYRECMDYIMSPTINLVGKGPGGATPNGMGITSSIANASRDVILWYDLYAGASNLSFTGISWVYGYQAYPNLSTNGAKEWGNRQYPGFIIFNPEPQCFTDFEPFAGNGFPFRSSNPGVPDSLRLLIGVTQQCFRFAISLGCNSNDGMYFDNISLAFVDQPGVPGQASASSTVNLGSVSMDIWQLINDAFPANETAGLPGTAAFDTTTALIRTGLNTAQATGNALRFDIPGDSSVVSAANATVGSGDDPSLAQVRVDMVFRILPGPGNYRIAGGRSLAPGGNAVTGVLLQVPTNQAAAAVSGDASFWGQYMADPGLVSRGSHTGPGGWDPTPGNSGRMDPTQVTIFPVGGAVPTGTALAPGLYQTTIHESDPKFATVGVNKFKCFVTDTTKSATSSPTLNNVACDGTVPAWLNTVPRSRTGWDGANVTKEFTQIIPDGLLTPGSHVQYFFRKSHAADPNLNYAMVPDTNVITPQSDEGSSDQHRWQQFGVLPDRWKNGAFGGAGSACLLYIDLNDRRGNEGRFVGVMDSISTAAAKWGAHNGWHAAGTTNINGLDVRTDASVVVANKNSQPGTTWDMYGVKASESLTSNAGQLGNRLANRVSMGFAAGKYAVSGPTPEMLRAYYRMVTILTGDLNSGLLGPYVNRSQNDIALLNDYLTAAGGTAQPRGIFIQGDGFGQSEKATGGIDPTHTQFLTDKLGVVFRNQSYQSISANIAFCADLLTTTALTPSADVYGVTNTCSFSHDVYSRNPALAESQEGTFYENVGLNGPYVADVVKPAVPLRNWIAVTSGYDIEHLLGRYCETDNGRLAYYYYMLNKVFSSVCQITSSPCGSCLEVPGGGRGRDFVDFMRIGDAVMRQGVSTVRLGIAHAGRVQVNVYDVAGRKVRTLADRVFPAGEAKLVWDGTDDAGEKVGRGVYFVRSSTQREAGRVIVLNR